MEWRGAQRDRHPQSAGSAAQRGDVDDLARDRAVARSRAGRGRRVVGHGNAPDHEPPLWSASHRSGGVCSCGCCACGSGAGRGVDSRPPGPASRPPGRSAARISPLAPGCPTTTNPVSVRGHISYRDRLTADACCGCEKGSETYLGTSYTQPVQRMFLDLS